ncbi:MAG: IS5 family transposase [Betaproteobacteria bacterium]|nr:IS5 family transposase [Betaproteobacteria bacterium]
MKQATLAMMNTGFELHSKTTKRAAFLARMETLVPWAEFCALIEPYYPKAGNGRPPVGVERMLRMYFIANWFNMADEACEDALHDIPVLREFCKIDLGRERVPDATTLLGFRHLLEEHDLGAAMFTKVGELLLSNGLKLSGGTIVDATIIAAPSSTKNADNARDPEMHQTRKGNQWHFGMKVHIGVDSKTGLTHSASITSANVHDSQELPNLLHGNETRLYGDSAYIGQKKVLKQIAPKARDFTNKRASRDRPLTDEDKETNRRKSQVRAKVEHPFRPLKSIYGFAKVRYRGLVKNANRAFALLALINLDKWGTPLTGQVRLA